MPGDHLSERTRRRLSRSPQAPPSDQQELPVAKLPVRVLADRTKRSRTRAFWR